MTMEKTAAVAEINSPAMQSPVLGTALSFFKLHGSAWYQRKAGSLAAIFDHAPAPVAP